MRTSIETGLDKTLAASQPAAPGSLMIVTVGLAFTLTAISSTLPTLPYDDRLTVQASRPGENLLNTSATLMQISIGKRKTSRLTALARKLRSRISASEWATMPSTAGLNIDDVINRS